MSYAGKYALAKHETLALKCEALESQLEEARYYATDYAMKLGRANEKLAEAREEALKYKIKYNNQSSDILRLRQSKKDQTELIRKLKEKGDE
jgi:hypothetical protein